MSAGGRAKAKSTEITPEEFKGIVDSIMRETHDQVVGALTEWFAHGGLGLPCVTTEVRRKGSRTTVTSRDELTLGERDGHFDALQEAIHGPRNMVPCILVFADLGWSYCVWIDPVETPIAIGGA